MLGNGDGTFAPEVRYPAGLGGNGIIIADFDSDGRQDLVTANELSNDVSLLPGLGDGTFGPQIRYATNLLPFSVAAGDLNGDAAPDLAVANYGSDDVWLFRNLIAPLRILDFVITFSRPIGRGSGTLIWTTSGELDLEGFNVVLLDASGNRTQINPVTIPCEECVTGLGHAYEYPVPKHKSGKNLFLEAVHQDDRMTLFGPAQKQ